MKPLQTNFTFFSWLKTINNLYLLPYQDPDKPIVEWVERMFADRRNRVSAMADISPLHMAIYKQHQEVAALLIERGANVNLKDQFGLTPFMLCALRSE